MSENCVCPTNFSGSKCESCAAIQCLNGGTCRKTGTFEKFRCSCLDEFTGVFCELDRCKGFCKNNGACSIHPVIGPKCTCQNNFSGDHCEINDLCPLCPIASNCNIKCHNGGYCVKDSRAKESCICIGEWIGTFCETPPRCIDDECGRCSELSSINECVCKYGLVQPCLIDESVTATEIKSNDDAVPAIIILLFILVLVSTLALVAVLYIRKWQRRTRFFAHARLNENVEEITNPIFDFAATDCDDISIPVTNISSNDDKVSHQQKLIPIDQNLFFSNFRDIFQTHFTNLCTHHLIRVYLKKNRTMRKKLNVNKFLNNYFYCYVKFKFIKISMFQC